MRSLVPFYGLLIVAVMVGGCGRHSVSRECPHDLGMKTHDQWRDSVSFPYNMPQVRKERIIENYDRLRVGSTKEEVVAVLGEPDFELELQSKEFNRPCHYAFVYYFEKPDGVLDNEIRDKRVEAFFSATGKATWIVSNISGLGEKGSPAAKDTP